MFADADPVITRALARYIADNDADASRVLGDFIDQNSGHVRGRARRQPTQVIFTAGEHHDLRADLSTSSTRATSTTRSTPRSRGAQRTGRPRRRNSIKMGSYSVEDRLIRIHRSLDRAFVPRFFVAWIVFHEMLHQVHDIRVKNGRREFHSKEFLADEAHVRALRRGAHLGTPPSRRSADVLERLGSTERMMGYPRNPGPGVPYWWISSATMYA